MKKTFLFISLCVAVILLHAQTSDNDWDGAGTGTMYPSDSNDNVGIGLTNPEVKFQVNNASSYSSPLPLTNHSVDSVYPGEIGALIYSSPDSGALTSVGLVALAESGEKECWGVMGGVGKPHSGSAHGLRIGVFGTSYAEDNTPEQSVPGINVGVSGMSNGDRSHNIGVKGDVVYGDSGYNTGVSGSAVADGGTMNAGVYGEAEGGNLNVGIYGMADVDSGSFAGYFEGDVAVEHYLGINTQSPRVSLDVNGKAIIGAQTITSGPHTDYRLAVDGKIVATEMVCTLDHWADFVLRKGYDLRSLEELNKYVTEHNQLPDMPSEQEVTEEGINLGQMDALLLRKIEELTLYTLEQEKRIQELEQQH